VELASNYIDQILIFSIYALSLNVLLGYAGQMSVAHAAFGAIGGYTAGYLAITYGWNVFFAAIVGMVLAGIVGAAVALPALRLSVEFLILLTLGVSSVLLGLFTTFPQLGGTYGLIGIPTASVFGVELRGTNDWLLPLAIIFLIVFWACYRLGESPFGRVLKGIRDDDQVTSSLGKDVVLAKVLVFGITSGFAGLAGALLAGFDGIATPGQFGFEVSLAIFAMVIFGGTGNLVGSVVGAASVVLTKPLLEWAVSLSPDVAGLWRLTLYGTLLVTVMLFRPQGLVPEGVNAFRPSSWRGGKSRSDRLESLPTAVAAAAHDWEASVESITTPQEHKLRDLHWAEAPVVLEVTNLSKSFGSIVAVEELSMVLRRGTITALVGPNGAGKTTVFNLLTKFIIPDRGSVRLNGRELVGLSPSRIAQAGIVRSWQEVRVIPRLSSLQNVMIGVQGQVGERLVPLFLNVGGVRERERAVRNTAMQWLEFVGMTDFADIPAGALSFGQSKLVALARVLATDADVLLLDEPCSGIDTQWVDAMLSLIEKVREQGRTVCIVEHNLHVVEHLADHTYFMELGRITAQGTFEELTNTPRLAEAYFGTA